MKIITKNTKPNSLAYIEKAIFYALENDIILREHITGIFSYIPANCRYPFIALREITLNDWSSNTHKGQEVSWELELFTSETSNKSCLELSNQIIRLLSTIALDNVVINKVELKKMWQIEDSWCAHININLYRLSIY